MWAGLIPSAHWSESNDDRLKCIKVAFVLGPNRLKGGALYPMGR